MNDPYGDSYRRNLRATHTRADLNDAQRTAHVNNEFLVVPQDVSLLRDALYIDGSLQNDPKGHSGRLDYNNDTYLVKTTATGSDRTAFETARIGTYRPGSVAVAGIYLQKDTPPSGKAEWGYIREERTVESQAVGDNGLYWRYTSDGTVSFVIEREGVETVIPQSEWGTTDADPRDIKDENGDVSGQLYGLDAMNGSGGYGIQLDPSEGYVYRIDFAWYGGGVIVPKVITLDREGRQMAIDLFAFKPSGQTSFAQPNQPITARLDNQGTPEGDQLKVAGRQFSVIGDFQDNQRETTHLRTGRSLSTSDTFVLALRRKPAYQGIELGFADIVTQVTGTSFVYEIINADFGSQTPDWQTPSGRISASETAIQVATQDTTGSALTVDTSVGESYNGTIIGSGKNTTETSSRGPVQFPIIREQPVVIMGRSLSGQSETIDIAARVAETW